MQAVADGPRAAPGSVPRLPTALREAWLDNLALAFAELPVLYLSVAPDGIRLGAQSVLPQAAVGLARNLHEAGLRALTLFSGASERELARVAALLVTDWSKDTSAFDEAIWAADLGSVWLDVERPNDARDEDAEWGGRPPGDSPAALALPPELAAEAQLVVNAADLEARTLAHVLGTAASAGVRSASAAARLLLSLAVDRLGTPSECAPLLHATLELMDPDLTLDADRRDAALRAASALAQAPLIDGLLAGLPSTDTPDLHGVLFSLSALLRDERDIQTLCERLPLWAVGMLADTVLMRELSAGRRLDAVSARLEDGTRSGALLGLAMASRLGDARLVDRIVAFARHTDADVREAALMALRQQALPDIRGLVLEGLDDASSRVRIEALRHAVAHRMTDVLPLVEERLCSSRAADLDEAELRALCISAARLGKEAAEGLLTDLVHGRRGTTPTLVRPALQGLRALPASRGRPALERIANEVPRLRADALALVGELR